MNRQQRRALLRDSRRSVIGEWAATPGASATRSIPPHFLAKAKRQAEKTFAERRYATAVELFRQVLKLAPDDLESHVGLVRSLAEVDKKAGIAHAEAVLERHPDDKPLRMELGELFMRTSRYTAAAEVFGRVVEEEPEFPFGNFKLGQAYLYAQRNEQALASFERALALGIDNVAVRVAIADCLWRLDRPEEAIAAYKIGIAMDPGDVDLHAKYVINKRLACDWSEFEADLKKIERACIGERRGAIDPFNVIAVGAGPLAQRVNADNWVRRYGAPLPTPTARRPAVTGQLRVGYVSRDFRRHATALLMAQLFERHDRTRFEITAYSYGPQDRSGMRRRLIEGFDRFVDISEMSDREAAERIREDGVDILVDIKGHANGARAGIVALRPAPLQVNFLVYPGTLGGGLADYIISDRFISPLEHQAHYSEKIVQLPDTYQVNDRTRLIADPGPSRAECGLPDDAFVFCSFNDSYKITPALFDVWMRLLTQVPDAVLWLLAKTEIVERSLRREAEARGVDPSRLVFAPLIGVPDHLARQRHGDLFLDCLEVNAHTTASEALWAGLPVLTCVGEAFASRVAGSLLYAADLPELVTHTMGEYEARALRLARDRGELRALRDRLAETRLTVPLFDIDRFTHHLELAYEQMWKIHLAGRSPEHFAVEGLPLDARAPERTSIIEVNAASDRSFAAAFALHQAGQIETVEAAYLAILQADPCHYNALQHLAIVAAQTGRLDWALHVSDQTLRTWPHQPPAHVTRSQIFRGLGRLDEAVTAAQMAVLLAPEDEGAQFQLGIVLRESGRVDEAIDAFQAACKLRPAFVEARYNLVELLQQQSRLEEALAALQEMAEV